MDERKHVCPACNVVFDAPPLAGPTVCPLCNAPLPDAATPPPPPQPAPLAAAAPPPNNLRWIAAAAVVAFVGGTFVLAMPQWTDPAKAPDPAPAERHPAEPAEPIPEKDSLPSAIDWVPFQPAQVLLPPQPPPGTPPPAAPAPTAPQRGPSPAQVDRAIERGVAYLKQHVADVRLPVRYEGLVGLALLECGVPPEDPVVQRIAASLRKQVSQLTGTYELSLAILFFDRLDSPGDSSRIRALGEVLASGQADNGAWGYQCRHPTISGPSTRRFGVNNLRPAVPPRQPPRSAVQVWTDHSNTQFAVLGLWVAQRHGRNTRIPLTRVDSHYRGDQNKDGGWSYRPNTDSSTLANTCSGLLALAAGHGINAQAGREARPLTGPQAGNEPVVAAGLERAGDFLVPAWARTGDPSHSLVVGSNYDLYTLWSVERVGTLYDLPRIGGREWYPDFAHLLVQIQKEDGSWRRSMPEPIDTSFALLVLRRSNLVPDLTAVIQGKPAPVRQPGLGWTAAQPAGQTLSPNGPARTPTAPPKPPPSLSGLGPAGTQPPRLTGEVHKVEPAPAKPPADPPEEKDP